MHSLTRSGLLNLGQIQIKQLVEEFKKLLPARKVGTVHHSDG